MSALNAVRQVSDVAHREKPTSPKATIGDKQSGPTIMGDGAQPLALPDAVPCSTTIRF
jgi:hypothetical protein